jgi:uncharacterized protein Yka (UPF0111/DUF47 family)
VSDVNLEKSISDLKKCKDSLDELQAKPKLLREALEKLFKTTNETVESILDSIKNK